MGWSELVARAWEERATVGDFARRIADDCASRYVESIRGEADLVSLDPGNGFIYLFDLADSLTGGDSGRSPRVVCVYGLSAIGAPRDKSRMAGFPRSSVETDDRGHLISCAAGGGYDINLVPMDSNLNQGRSEAGLRFRAMETAAANVPGSLFLMALDYVDGSDRPSRFDVAVQRGEALEVASFSNAREDNSPRSGSVLRRSTPLDLEPSAVMTCLDLDSELDRLFAGAWHLGSSVLGRNERNRLAGTTGHIAESVAELMLSDLGWHSLWHLQGPGRHGVDLVMLAPGDLVVVVEVKGTLVPRRIPRLTRRELAQMSADWVDKADNPGMGELGLTSDDVFGAVVVVNFADLTWRVSLTSDFARLIPISGFDALGDLSWLRDHPLDDRPTVDSPGRLGEKVGATNDD